MVGICRKRTISAPELETSRHERWEQKLAKEIRKPQKIFYHPHVYKKKNVGRCNFLCLFPCSLTHYLMFPCSVRFFCFVPVFLLPNFPCSLVPQNPGRTLINDHTSLLFATFSISALSVFTSSFPKS